MKILVAILTCRAHAALEESQRQAFKWQERSWEVPAHDRRYFFGGDDSTCAATDQVHLAVGDDVPSLPFKSQAMNRWALDRGYDWIYRGDTDCYVHLPRLLAAVPEGCDYSGYFRGNHEVPGGYASGGSGYWLSRAALERTVEWRFNPDWEDGERGYVNGEDLQVGKCLNSHEMWCRWDERYRLDDLLPAPDNDTIASHSVRNPLKTVEAMNAAHKWVVRRWEPGNR